MSHAIDLSNAKHHPTSELIVSLLRKTNQNTLSDGYFRCLTTFYLGQVASTMRASVETEDRGVIPCNIYAFLLAGSGFGKSRSMHLIERTLLSGFYRVFRNHTLRDIGEEAMSNEALLQASYKATSYDEELELVQQELASCGSYKNSFGEGSGPAYRQIRTICQIYGIGSTNLIIDEVGYNLDKMEELLTVHMDVYDVGLIKDKITKSNNESKRYRERDAGVPANLLAFGSPEKVFDGSKTEKDFVARVENGYGRRFIYGYGVEEEVDDNVTAEQIYDQACACASNADIEWLEAKFTQLADAINFNQVAKTQRAEGIFLTQYKLWCVERANALPQYDTIRRKELAHRYFRVLKIAGIYAFIDTNPYITREYLEAAMLIVEDSGECLDQIMNRPKPHVRLAQFVVNAPEPVTHADLYEKLPGMYPSAKNRQDELWRLAISWGYQNHCLIRRYSVSEVEFFKGEPLQETNLEHMRISYSQHQAYNYENREVAWDQIQELSHCGGYFFLNHYVTDGHRIDKNIIQGCDFLVLDCDGEVSLQQFSLFMQNTLCHVYTTKSHTDEVNRFRALIPLKYRVTLDKQDYKRFVNNVLGALPWIVKDDCANQRSKRWSSHDGQSGTIQGELFDPLPYLPNTQKCQERQAVDKKLKNLSRIEKFFAKQWENGRNNTCLRYGMMLLDSGIELEQAIAKLRKFNESFEDPIEDDRLASTVIQSMTRKATGQ